MIVKRAIAVLVVLAGCGNKPQKTKPWRMLHAPQPAASPAWTKSEVPRLRLVGVVRPSWPLTTAPSLEPHYRIASPWYAACERRGRLHDDELAYVEAWCRYRATASFDLGVALMPLRSSRVPKLADAVHLDLANYLADRMTGREALDWMWPYRLRLHALLAAVYIDLGRIDDAELVSVELRASAPRGSCARDLALLRFADDVDRFTDVLARHAGASCEREVRGIICAIEEGSMLDGVARDPAIRCANVLDDDGHVVARAYAAWHRAQHSLTAAERGLGVADLAMSALAVPDAEDLALRALEQAAWRATSCSAFAEVAKRVQQIEDSPHAQHRFADRRARVLRMAPAACRE